MNDITERYPCKKIPYKSRQEAIATAKYRPEVDFGKPYKCWFCKNWHLGHKIPKKSKFAIKWRKNHKAMKALFDLIDQICGVKEY